MSDIDEPFHIHHYRKRPQKPNQQQQQRRRFPSPNVSVASAAAAALLATATGVAGGSGVVGGTTGQIIAKRDEKNRLLKATGSNETSKNASKSREISPWDESPDHKPSSNTFSNFLNVQPSTSRNFYLNVPTQKIPHASSAPVTPQNASRGPSPSICSAPSPIPPIVLDELFEKHRRGSLSSPLYSFSRELKELRKRSISDISLILEIIRGATGNDYTNKGRRNTKANISGRVTSLSTGNLMPSTSSEFLDIPSTNHSPTLSRISSFLRQKRSKTIGAKIGWQQRFSPNNIQRTMHLVQEEKAMQLAPMAPIDANKFVAYVQERRKKRILFKGEFLVCLLF